MNFLNSIHSKLHGSVNPNSVQYIRQQDLKVQLDPSGTDFVDYTGQPHFYAEAHSLNPQNENSTALTILEKSPSTSPFSLASQNQYTICLKYKVQDTNKPLIGHYFGDSRYDLSINNTIFYTGDTIQITVLKASDSTVDYAITGDFTTADLNNASLTGTISNIVSSFQYSILSGDGNFTFSLTGVSPTQQLIATVYRKYWVKVVTNWASQSVFAFSDSGPSGIYYEQPNLSFNTGDYLLFDVGDSSMTDYSLVFGTVVDGGTILSAPYVSETTNVITLDLTSYSETTVYYFENTRANMGYVEATITSTYDVLFKDIYPTELSHPDEPRTIMYLNAPDLNQKVYTGRGGYKNRGLTGSLLKNLSWYEYLSDGILYHMLIRITVGETLVKTLTFNDFYYRSYQDNNLQIRIGINTVNDVMYELTSKITSSGSLTNNFTNLFTANTTYTSTKYNDLTDTTGTSSTECQLYNTTITFSTPTPIRCIYITNIEQWSIYVSYDGDTRGIAVTDVSVLPSYQVTVANGVFVIDGVSKDNITFTNGETYVFDQSDSTNAGFPIVFGTSPESSSLYTTGVTVVGTPGQAGAYTKLVYTDSTALYYFSSGAASMGYSPTWTLLFRQTYGYGWSVNPATNSLNESDTSNQNYSIINSLYGTTNYKNGDHYHFKYIDKTNNETVEWKQTSNFVETNNSVTGYELISSTINPVPWNFGGLAISANSSNTYYDGNPGSTSWFYPIGQKNTTFGNIPAFISPYAQQIELWVYS